MSQQLEVVDPLAPLVGSEEAAGGEFFPQDFQSASPSRFGGARIRLHDAVRWTEWGDDVVSVFEIRCLRRPPSQCLHCLWSESDLAVPTPPPNCLAQKLLDMQEATLRGPNRHGGGNDLPDDACEVSGSHEAKVVGVDS